MITVVFLNVANADSIVVQTSSSKGAVIDLPKPRIVTDWFREHNCTHIEHIFLTHNHTDHAPPIKKLSEFLTSWLRFGTVGYVYMPTTYLQTNLDSEERKHILDQLESLQDDQKVRIVRAEQSSTSPCLDDIEFQILYPSVLDVERVRKHENEISLVLRLKYGEFAALLPADIDKSGLKKLLERYNDLELQSQIVKIPHHGAWPSKYEAEWRELLDKSDPEFAVLSVGSRNSHKHVKPQLFKELLNIQQNKKARLRQFVCTEATRTCFCSAQEQKDMGSSGLSSREPCAGDVTIIAESDGSWEFANKSTHDLRLNEIPRPACLGQTDLSKVDPA